MSEEIVIRLTQRQAQALANAAEIMRDLMSPIRPQLDVAQGELTLEIAHGRLLSAIERQGQLEPLDT